MRNMKRMIAVAMLAVFATLGAQTVKADGVLLSDRNGILVTDQNKTDGVLLSDKQNGTTVDDVINAILNSLTGVLIAD